MLHRLPIHRFRSFQPSGKPQQTLACPITISGTTLHSGARTTARLLPALAGEGRYFVAGDPRSRIPASVEYAVESPLCTALRRDGMVVRTVEHLLSALEGSGVDNCRIEIEGGDEVPILDGSSKEWVDAIRQAGLSVAKDCNGSSMDKMVAFVHKPVFIQRDDSFMAAFPSPKIQITYGINFPQVPALGCQWFSCFPMDDYVYTNEIAASRTFCVFEEVEALRKAGLIKGGSLKNALVCSAREGWLNPPLRYDQEPCRHKILDLIGDLSLLAYDGHQGLPVAHLVGYKAGHSMHVELARRLTCRGRSDEDGTSII